MLGDNLMALWFKPQDGYTVPQAPSRYVNLGMSFKKNEEKKQGKPTVNKRRVK